MPNAVAATDGATTSPPAGVKRRCRVRLAILELRRMEGTNS